MAVRTIAGARDAPLNTDRRKSLLARPSGMSPRFSFTFSNNASGATANHRGSTRSSRMGEDGELNPKGAKNESDRVQAVVAYFPPTDFLNYGTSGTFFDGVVREAIPGGKNPYLQAMDYLIKGHMLADVPAVLGSMDIVFGEVDR